MGQFTHPHIVTLYGVVKEVNKVSVGSIMCHFTHQKRILYTYSFTAHSPF